MRNIQEIFIDDLKSIYKNFFVCIVVVFLMFIPSIYAWFNIVASWDPYANTEGILVGVANNDKGAELNGEAVNIGKEVLEGLKENKDLGWRFTSEKKAIAKVEKGDFYASIIIPENFSEHIATIMTDDPKKAEIDYYVNEKINSIAPKITAAGANSIVDDVSKTFIKSASGSILAIFNELGITLQNELPTIQKMKNMVYLLESELPELEQNIKTVQTHVKKAEDIIKKVNEGLDSIEGITSQKDKLVSDVSSYVDSTRQAFEEINPLLKNDIANIRSDNESILVLANRLTGQGLPGNESDQLVEQGVTRINKELYLLDSMYNLLVRVNQFNEKNVLQPEIQLVDELRDNASNQLQALNDRAYGNLIELGRNNDQVLASFRESYSKETGPKFNEIWNETEAILNNVQLTMEEGTKVLPEVRTLLNETNRTLETRTEDIDKLQNKFPEIETKIKALASKMREIDKSYNMEEVIDFLRNDIEQESEFFSEPVLLNKHSLFPIPNYGSAMSPFFTALSLWVGGTILISMLSVGVSQKVYSPYQVYIGRYLIFFIIGVMQALSVSVGNIVLIGVYVADKFEYILFSVLISTVFTLIVYTFVSVLGNVGKGISVVLMVLQISSSGGTFPIQVTPPFFQHINPFLPFTYAVGLLRESVGGITWSVAGKDIFILILFLLFTFILGVILKKPLHARTQKMKDKLYGSRIF
ncbi:MULTISPECIES: YhgE/Pip domain-containing protein [unclassified Bacillus (in: firmicutes)]|uniref:YhgE/Pip domain-containing protein n=1 Tax=unclassified Bacillus (in: firmicutes) TaxID=185979 RepID=UPI001BE7B9AF|nr:MULTISPECIES: YhgE/Pip domain-containing protein [unclassified Bacillus (in: firmicutes)]MBT2614483.1 YhgE/Pip domain-containing protein [Bacillus sp. ISL-78]MBT2628462.1 YhgE/Pip domain-containing protein [Bacillus sp. ISL-101]